MQEPQKDPPINLGIYDLKTNPPRMSRVDLIALALSIFWLLLVAMFFLFTAQSDQTVDSLQFLMTLLAIFVPVALIWIGATAVRTGKTLREESERLQTAIEAMRQTYVQTQIAEQAMKPSVERKLDEIAAATRKTESVIATFSSVRLEGPGGQDQALATSEPSPLPEPDGQAKLPLGSPSDGLDNPVSISDFIKAIHFPENAEDQDGFRALRRALEHRDLAALIRSSQDLLTMLSQDGIYMDDLHPDRARPEVWRKFAAGERGRAIAGLGGVRDRTCLALTASRMREDDIFRDSAHHFLRRFDTVFAAFAETATDADIVALSDTRTARAFMLIGRVTGTFT